MKQHKKRNPFETGSSFSEGKKSICLVSQQLFSLKLNWFLCSLSSASYLSVHTVSAEIETQRVTELNLTLINILEI